MENLDTRNMFSAYVKRALLGCRNRYLRELKRQREREPSFSSIGWDNADDILGSYDTYHLEQLGIEDEICNPLLCGIIDPLTVLEKEVLTLKYVYRYRNAEIASILGMTTRAIELRQHRILKKLRSLVMNYGQI